MRIFNGLLAGLTTLLVASAATAALTVSASSTSDLSNIAIGEEFTINISISTSGNEAQSLGLRAANYNPDTSEFVVQSGEQVENPDFDPSAPVVIQFVSATVPASIFNFSPSVPFGGLSNSASGVEEIPATGIRAGISVNLFQGVSVSAAAGAGPEAFDVTFTGLEEGTTTIDIGAFADYSDTYGGGDNGMNPASVTITVVPEPGAVAASLAAIGSVFGVAAVRRRR